MLGLCITYGHCLKDYLEKAHQLYFHANWTDMRQVSFSFQDTSENFCQIMCHYLNVLSFPIQITSAAL